MSNTNVGPKNVYEVLKLFMAVIKANAVQAARGSVQDYEDALQEGKLICLEAWKSADPRKGDPYQYIALRLTAARNQARDDAMEQVTTESDMAPDGEQDGDDLMEAVPALEEMAAIEDIDPFDNPDWAQYGPLYGEKGLIADSEMALIFASFNLRLQDNVPDAPAGDPSPSWTYNVPEPIRLPGSAFAIYAEGPEVQEDGLHPERISAMQDEHGNWPDSQTLGEITVVDEDGLEIEDEPIERDPSLLDWEDAEPGEDTPWEPYSAIPALEEIEQGLAQFFLALPKPEKYSRASRETFIRAMLKGAGMKAANTQAWNVHKNTIVSATRSGLVQGNGLVMPWAKAVKSPWSLALDTNREQVCAAIWEHLKDVPEATQFATKLEYTR